MLHIHFSNRLELLRAALLQRLDATVPADPFTPRAGDRAQRGAAPSPEPGAGRCSAASAPTCASTSWRNGCGSRSPAWSPASATNHPMPSVRLSWRVHAAFGDAAFVAQHPRLAAYLQRRRRADALRAGLPGGRTAGAVRHLPERLAAGLARRPPGCRMPVRAGR